MTTDSDSDSDSERSNERTATATATKGDARRERQRAAAARRLARRLMGAARPWSWQARAPNALAALAVGAALARGIVAGPVPLTLTDYDGRTGERFTVALVAVERQREPIPVLCRGAALAAACDSVEHRRARFTVHMEATDARVWLVVDRVELVAPDGPVGAP